MFDLGWTELLVIGIVALIVVGPKDLPVLFRQVGRFMGKARAMGREFSRAMNDAADESGVRDIGDTVRAAADPKSYGVDAIRDAVRDPLDADRADAKAKIEEAAAKAARERQAIEARTAELNASADEMAQEATKPDTKGDTA